MSAILAVGGLWLLIIAVFYGGFLFGKAVERGNAEDRLVSGKEKG